MQPLPRQALFLAESPFRTRWAMAESSGSGESWRGWAAARRRDLSSKLQALPPKLTQWLQPKEGLREDHVLRESEALLALLHTTVMKSALLQHVDCSWRTHHLMLLAQPTMKV